MTNSKTRVSFYPTGGGRIRTMVTAAIIGETMLLLIYDANAETSYEPPMATADDPLKVQVGNKNYSVLSGGFFAEDNGLLYLALPILKTAAGAPADESADAAE